MIADRFRLSITNASGEARVTMSTMIMYAHYVAERQGVSYDSK